MTNDEFSALLKLKKHFAETNINLPTTGNKLENPIAVFSNTTKDVFALDIDRKGISFTKKKLQERHSNSNTVMIRLEIDCRPHMYADGHFSSRNHIHIFDEQNGYKTFNLEGEYANIFTDTNDFIRTFYDFCSMCNIETDDLNVQGVI